MKYLVIMLVAMLDAQAPEAQIDISTPSSQEENALWWNKGGKHSKHGKKHGKKHHKHKKCCVKYVTVTVTPTCEATPAPTILPRDDSIVE
ncbi:hypothetical protein BGX31_009959 [Mortierella sp. GBA43]|nr:hypothetical protein BGX31_009959 [Mortierella sp. GBA43]